MLCLCEWRVQQEVCENRKCLCFVQGQLYDYCFFLTVSVRQCAVSLNFEEVRNKNVKQTQGASKPAWLLVSTALL